MNDDLELVKRYQKEMAYIGHALALLGWDEETYMPEQGVQSRAESKSFLSSLIHSKMISDELYQSVQRLKNKKLTGDDKLIIIKLDKDVKNARKLPTKFIQEMSKTVSLGHHAWLDARKKNNFKIFQPHLQKIIKLKRKEANYIKLPGHPYNSLLDDYEEGMTAEELKPVFKTLKVKLIDLLGKIKSSKQYKKQKLVLLKKKYPKDLQMDLIRDVTERIGLEKEFSRIDFSEHPFSTEVGMNDVRITTNIRKDPLFAFAAAIHEAGHALYELSLPKKHYYNVLGGAPSLGLHESQSRFWENMIGRNKPFWDFYFSVFNKKFGLKGHYDEWYKEVNFVHPGMIRVQSDEVHYCLHIILRFEIELGLMDGSIKVKDLPKIWNDKMKDFFGVAPKSDYEGVLQDVHWSWGAIGYFPTYALGSIYSAQLYNALKRKHVAIENDIKKGDYKRIKKWLLENIHKHGSKFIAEDIIKKTCGKGLDPDAYIKYLTDKYSKIYSF